MGFAPPYQTCDNGGGAINSGVAWNMTQNTGAGRVVVTCIRVRGNDTVASVTGLGASWSKINAVQCGGSAKFIEMWIGTGTTGGSKAITTTMTGGSQYSAWAIELGSIATVISGGTAKATNTGTPALTIGGLADGDMVIAVVSCSALLSGGPTTPPWTVYNQGGYKPVGGTEDVAYQLTTSSASQTPSWGNSSNGSWGVAAAILTPATISGNPLVMVV
jgi:hypothetical protein